MGHYGQGHGHGWRSAQCIQAAFCCVRASRVGQQTRGTQAGTRSARRTKGDVLEPNQVCWFAWVGQRRMPIETSRVSPSKNGKADLPRTGFEIQPATMMPLVPVRTQMSLTLEKARVGLAQVGHQGVSLGQLSRMSELMVGAVGAYGQGAYGHQQRSAAPFALPV